MTLYDFGVHIPYIILLFFLLGSSIYSFLNAVIYRIPRHMDIIAARSRCTKCGHTLSYFDMLPVLGWILLRGKCRYCHARISVRYPIVEAMGGGIALLCVCRWGISLQAFASFLFLAILTAVAFVDMDTMKIPDCFIIAAELAGIISIPVFPEINLAERLLGIFSVSAFLLAIALIMPNGFGGGDIKLTAVCGFFLGWRRNLTAFVLAVLIAGIYCIFMLAARKISRRSKLAFGPFLCLGMAIVLFVRIW